MGECVGDKWVRECRKLRDKAPLRTTTHSSTTNLREEYFNIKKE
jgi:hypothetical protein